MRILVGAAAPNDASVAVRYNNRWFWVADTDIQSKTIFAIVMLLFSISETGIRGSAPVVSIPASQSPASSTRRHVRTKPILYNDSRSAEPIGIGSGVAHRIGARLLHEAR